MPEEYDLSFLDDASKEIKKHLEAFIAIYEALTDEQQAATKRWLEQLAALGQTPPAPSFGPRIVLDKMLLQGEGEAFHLRLPVDLVIRAIKTCEQKIEYPIDVDDMLKWYY